METWLTPLLAAVVAFMISVVAVHLLARGWLADRAADVPNERSSHTVVTPRTGGLGLLLGAGVAAQVFAPSENALAFAIAVGLCALSFADDLWGLTPKLRLILHAAAAAVFMAVTMSAPLLLYPVAFLTIVWMTNLYNFMDGSDGMAGGMAVFGFGAYALAGLASDALDFSVLPAALAGAAAGFLVWNSHKAIVFMGDSGSIPLGFLAAVLGIAGWQQGLWPFWFPGLVFLPFILDTTITLLHRIRRGETLSEAHKSHYYQRALQLGLGHRGTALSAYVLMLGGALTAVMFKDADLVVAAVVILCWLCVYAMLFMRIDRLWAAHVAEDTRAG